MSEDIVYRLEEYRHHLVARDDFCLLQEGINEITRLRTLVAAKNVALDFVVRWSSEREDVALQAYAQIALKKE